MRVRWKGRKETVTQPQDTCVTYPSAESARLGLPGLVLSQVRPLLSRLSQGRRSQSCVPKTRSREGGGTKGISFASTCSAPETFCRLLGPSLAYDWAPAQLTFGLWSLLALEPSPKPQLPVLESGHRPPPCQALPLSPEGWNSSLHSNLSCFKGPASSLMAQTGRTSVWPLACCKRFVNQKPK